MFKRDPDDLISAASKNLKKQMPKTMRITFKRGGSHFSEISKAHSRIAKRSLRQKVKQYANEHENETWPLYVRYKQNSQKTKEQGEQNVEATRLNCQVKVNKGNDFIRSLMGVFRVNFFKKKEQQGGKQKPQPTKKNPNSKRTQKKISKNLRNRQRRQKRKKINKQAKRQDNRQSQQKIKQQNTIQQ